MPNDKARGSLRGPCECQSVRGEPRRYSIAVVVWLVRTVGRNAQVLSLILAEFGELCTKLPKVQTRQSVSQAQLRVPGYWLGFRTLNNRIYILSI